MIDTNRLLNSTNSFSPPHPGDRKRILLVDDDPVFAKVLSRTARDRGIEVTVCLSIEDFMHQRDRDFDCCVVDLNLGSQSPVNGIELVEYLDSMVRDLHVVMVSQYDLAMKRHAVPKKHSVRFLSKKEGVNRIIDRAVSGGFRHV